MAPLALALPWALPAGSQIAWGTTAMMYGSAAAAGGALYQGRQAQIQGRNQQAMAEYNARVMGMEAKAIEKKTQFEQIQHRKAATRIEKRLKARLAASGAIPDVGIALLLQDEQASEMDLENALIGAGGSVEASRARSAAYGERLGGKYAKKRGKSAQTASYFGAGTSLLQGFGKYA